MSDVLETKSNNSVNDNAEIDVMIMALSEAMDGTKNSQSDTPTEENSSSDTGSTSWTDALSFNETIKYLIETFKGVSAQSLVANKLSSLFGGARAMLFTGTEVEVEQEELSEVDAQLTSFGLPKFADFTTGLRTAVLKDVDELLAKLESFTSKLTTEKFEAVMESKVKKEGNEALSFFVDNIGPFLGLGTAAIGGYLAYIFWNKKGEKNPLTQEEQKERDTAEEVVKKSAFSFLIKKEDADSANRVSFKISDLMRCNTMDLACALHYEKIMDFFINKVQVEFPDLTCSYDEKLELTTGLGEFSVKNLDAVVPRDYDITVTDAEDRKYKGTFVCSRWNNEIEPSPKGALSSNFVIGMSGFLLCEENGSVIDISLRAEFVREAGFIATKYTLEDISVERMEFVEF